MLHEYLVIFETGESGTVNELDESAAIERAQFYSGETVESIEYMGVIWNPANSAGFESVTEESQYDL